MRRREDSIERHNSGRMYAIDIQDTAYESVLTRERENVGFGAAATTIGLATDSSAVSTAKGHRDGHAGFVTGAFPHTTTTFCLHIAFNGFRRRCERKGRLLRNGSCVE